MAFPPKGNLWIKLLVTPDSLQTKKQNSVT